MENKTKIKNKKIILKKSKIANKRNYSFGFITGEYY